MKLYELSQEYRTLTALLEEDGADETGVKLQLEAIVQEFTGKAEAIGKIILSNNAETETLTAEINRLTNRKTGLTTKTEWLKEYLLTEMQNAGQDKIKTAVLTVSIRTNPPSVKILDLNLIPPEFRTIIPESWQPDKRKILEQAKNFGEVIAGTEIVTDRKSLSVR